MPEKKTRIILDTWIARIGSIFGWCCLVFWAVPAIVGLAELPEAKRSVDYAAPVICLGLAAVHWLLIRAMKRTKELVKDFRLYSSVLAQDPDKSIPGIAEALKLPEEQVMNRLQAMCRREGVPLYLPEIPLCTDNGALIASAAYFRLLRGETAPLSMNAEPALRLV